MNFYEINYIGSYVFTAIVLFFLAIFVYLRNRKNFTNITFSLYSLCLSWWSLFSIFMLMSSNEKDATFWDKICLLGVIYIPTTFLHFVLCFQNTIESKKKVVKACYIISSCFVVTLFTPYFIIKTAPVYKLNYFSVPGPVYYMFMIFFSAATFYALWLLFRAWIKSNSILARQQNQYLFFATMFGYAGTSMNYSLVFKIPPYSLVPYANYLGGLYGLIIAYAIIKYRLMDIKLAFTRASIFIIVYTLVLGIPFFIGFKHIGVGFWLIPTTLMAIFATVGPFVYLYFQRKAEERLLAKQHQYQFTLRRASLGMGRIKDLKRLLTLIVHVVTRTVRIEHCSIYLFHEASNQFILKASKGIDKISDNQSMLSENSALMKYLKKYKEPIVREEIKQKSKDFNDKDLKEVEKGISDLKMELIIPSYIEDKMLAVIALGKKRSRKLYTQEDIVVFSILANQSALAIENAQFYEDTKKTHEQLFRAEKMATIGTMADGLSHQINNRLHAMGFIAGDILDTIKIERKKGMPKKADKVLKEVEAGLNRIEDNVKRGGEIVEGLLKYTRKGTKGFEAVDLDKLISAAVEMAQFKIKISGIDINRNYNGNTPKVKGNFTQLQEVFFNIIDNSYDAMMQRKEEMKEESYRGVIEITAVINGTKLEIGLSDNGMGVRESDKNKLFAPFFTTKLSSRKGTGLGLYMMRQIIEENHKGKVVFTSEYGVGSQTRILLPIAKM